MSLLPTTPEAIPHARQGATRPPAVPRSERPFSALDAILMQVITAHAGKPCPTRRDIRDWTGMPRRRVWPYLEGMGARGLIQIETRGTRECGKDPKLRRMRVLPDGGWTGWTARRPHQ